MKLILKEYIKVRCNPQNYVLCSYFIKTFLFWKYETTGLDFWREDNLRECIKYLLVEFFKCLREGVLRHYFIPRFNLLSVKLTQAAQSELLSLFDIVIQSDISILKECRTLQNVWSEFIQFNVNMNNFIRNNKAKRLLINDVHTMQNMQEFDPKIAKIIWSPDSSKVLSKVLALFCKTPIRTLVLKAYLFWMQFTFKLLPYNFVQGNRGVYHLHLTAHNESVSYDISTCKLWCTMLLIKRGELLSALNIINQLLSSIPPFAVYGLNFIGTDLMQLYMHMFVDSDTTMIQRARKAWMFHMILTKE